MKRATINISIPEAMRLFVENKVKDAGYGSISEYFRELIRMDQRREVVSRAAISDQETLEERRARSLDEWVDML